MTGDLTTTGLTSAEFTGTRSAGAEPAGTENPGTEPAEPNSTGPDVTGLLGADEITVSRLADPPGALEIDQRSSGPSPGVAADLVHTERLLAERVLQRAPVRPVGTPEGPPDGRIGTPEGTNTAPEGTRIAPEGTNTAPEGTRIAPEVTAGTPGGTSTAPGDRADAVPRALDAGPGAGADLPLAESPLVVARLIGDRPVELLPRDQRDALGGRLPDPLPPVAQRVRWDRPSSLDTRGDGAGTGTVAAGRRVAQTAVATATATATGTGTGTGFTSGGFEDGGTGTHALDTYAQRWAGPDSYRQPVSVQAVPDGTLSSSSVAPGNPLSVVARTGAGRPEPGVPREVSWPGMLAAPTGPAAESGPTVQRADDPPPPPEPSPPAEPPAPVAGPPPATEPGPGQSGTPAAGPAAAGGTAVAGLEPEELLKKLFDPLLRRLKTELRLDRERHGMLGGPG